MNPLNPARVLFLFFVLFPLFFLYRTVTVKERHSNPTAPAPRYAIISVMRSLAWLALALSPAVLAQNQTPQKQPFDTAAMLKIQRIGDPQLSPDGKTVAFSVSLPDVDGNRSLHSVWSVPLEGGPPHKLADEAERPRWSPDGKIIYYVGSSGGTSQIWRMNPDGTSPAAVAVNPVTGNIYVANAGSASVTVITEQPVQPVPLSTVITPLPGNQVGGTTPGYQFNAQSSFSPTAPAPQNVFYQVDTWQGPWTQATNLGSAFSATLSPLAPGYHILYAYADDGQDATSVQLDSPLVGAIAAHGFLVAPLSFTLQPASQTVASGHTVVFNATAAGAEAATCQWTFNGAPITGATDGILVISDATSANAGTYACLATTSAGTLASGVATLTVVGTTDPGYLTNLSGRGVVGPGAANALIGGFGISGSPASPVPKQLLIRGIGPSLALPPFSLPGVLSDTQLTLLSSTQAVLGQNSPWGGTTALMAADAGVGAYPVPANSLDSMLDVLLSGPGAFSAAVTGVGGATGLAVVEIYDADPSPPPTRLINVSVRAPVGTGANILIGGFVIGGTTAETVLIRAIGPSLALAPFNLTGVLAQPVLTLYNSNPAVLASNTVWSGDPVLAATEATVGAYAIAAASQDSLLLVTLPPGDYTAQVSGVNGGTGIAAVEIYEVP